MESQIPISDENNHVDSNFYLINNQDILYQDSNLKKYKLNSVKSVTAKIIRNDAINKQNLGFQSGYLNSSHNANTSSIQENSSSYTLSRNDDILINNFRPFSNNVNLTGINSSNNIINNNNGIQNNISHQSLSATINSYNSQPTLSTSSTNSRLLQTNGYSNNSNQSNLQRVSTQHNSNSNRITHSSQYKNATEFHHSNLEKSYSKQHDQTFNYKPLKQYEDKSQIENLNNRQNSSSNYNRSNSFAITGSNFNNKNQNFDEEEYFKRWDPQCKFVCFLLMIFFVKN